jgi:hypothetical protein
MRLEPFTERVAAGHVDGLFKVVSRLVILAVDERGPAEMVMEPADSVGEVKTLTRSKSSLEEWARLGSLARNWAEFATPEVGDGQATIIANVYG